MARKALILCVDDYESILTGWTMLLESRGYQVLSALDSNRAMALFVAQPVNAVVLDSELWAISGDVVAGRMKSLKPDIPILMVSGDDPPSDEKLGAVDAFLFKRDSITTFLATVKALLNRPRLTPGNSLVISDRGCAESCAESRTAEGRGGQ